MRVLVVSANRERLPDPVPPIGALYVAGAARDAGHEVSFFDCCFAKDAEAELGATLDSVRPDVVGVSLRNVDDVGYPSATSYVPGYRSLVGVVRARARRAKLVLGGAAFTLFPEELMATLGPDFGIAGPGEDAFPELLRRIESGAEDSPRLLRAPALTKLRREPAREWVDVGRYLREGGSISIQTKRGCVFQCCYCTYPVLEGSSVTARDPRDVVAEMERARDEQGVDSFFFVDNVFNQPPSHAGEICRELLRRDLKVRWTCYASPAGLTRELLDSMAAAGCRSIDLGTDAASPVTLAALGKAFRVDEVARVSAWCHEVGLLFNHSLIFGGPGETWETARETVANIVATRPTSVIATIGVRLQRGTRLARLLGERSIGLEPTFYVAPAVREGLPGFLAGVARDHRNWIVPGLRSGMDPELFSRLRARGVRGPLWELLG